MVPTAVQTIIQVDSFTSRPFAGNPAGVCILEAPRDDGWMQAVAREMNLSETAFLLREGDGFRLRWFTPTTEVDLCGHATLASAHVLWEDGHLGPDDEARFYTRSGLLKAVRDGAWITMDFPAEPERPAKAPPGLARALGVDAGEVVYVGRNRFDFLVEVEAEKTVRDARPDLTALAAIPARGIILTARAAGGSPPGAAGAGPGASSGGAAGSDAATAVTHDFVSRFFAPAVGVPEDPVTGSAHCCLGPYWARRLGKDEVVGYQVSARGGIVKVCPRGDRVLLGGQAVTVMRCGLVGESAL